MTARLWRLASLGFLAAARFKPSGAPVTGDAATWK